MKKQKSSGFTLIEVLVVVLIIGILTSVALPQYQKSVKKTRAMQGVQALKDILSAQQVYYETYGTYTGDLSKLDVDVAIPADFKIVDQNNYMLVIQRTNSSYYYTLNAVFPQGFGYCFTGRSEPKNIKLCQSISIGDYEHDETAVRYYIF